MSDSIQDDSFKKERTFILQRFNQRKDKLFSSDPTKTEFLSLLNQIEALFDEAHDIINHMGTKRLSGKRRKSKIAKQADMAKKNLELRIEDIALISTYSLNDCQQVVFMNLLNNVIQKINKFLNRDQY